MEDTILGLGYHISASLYLQVVNSCLPPESVITDFYWIFINKKDNSIANIKMSDILKKEGDKEVEIGIKKYKRLQKEGFFDTMKLEPYVTFLKKEEELK
jgi:hypothetical protein